MCQDNGEQLVGCRIPDADDGQSPESELSDHKMLNCAESGRMGANFVDGYLPCLPESTQVV